MSGVIHVVLNDYRNDNRVRRAAEAGAGLGHKVWVFSLHRHPQLRWEWRDGVWTLRFALRSRSWPRSKPVQLIKYAEAGLRMLRRGILVQPQLVHAHDVDALPIGWLIARVTGAKLIYDAHELWCDPAHQGHLPTWIFRSMVGIERCLARCANGRITVSTRIARYIRARLALPLPTVVRNIPERWPDPERKRLRSALGIADSATIILYQGAIDGKGVHLLLHAFRQLRGPAHLVFLGDGTAVEGLRRASADLQDGERQVLFHPSVPAAELPWYTSDADIGVHPMAAGFLNHSWALPNKLFEYIQGGLAVVVSALPEMAELVRQHGCGMTFPPGDASALAIGMQRLLDDPEQRRAFQAAARRARDALCWENERGKLLALYAHAGLKLQRRNQPADGRQGAGITA